MKNNVILLPIMSITFAIIVTIVSFTGDKTPVNIALLPMFQTYMVIVTIIGATLDICDAIKSLKS